MTSDGLPGSQCSDEHLKLTYRFLRSYLETRYPNGDLNVIENSASLFDSDILFPRSLWLDLAKHACSLGMTPADELSACQAQRICAENDPSHPLSRQWRPANEAHFQAVVRRMKEGLPWADVKLLEDALVTACGFIDKYGLERAYRVCQFRKPGDRHRAAQIRVSAWRQVLKFIPAQAEHFDIWLNCEAVPEDYVPDSNPQATDHELRPPQLYLSLTLRYPDGDVPDVDRKYCPAAFSEDIPKTVEDCSKMYVLKAYQRLSLRAIPWPEWNIRMETMVSDLATQTECDPEEVWSVLNKITDDYHGGYKAVSANLEEIDTWMAMTRTDHDTEGELEMQARCTDLAEEFKLRKSLGVGNEFFDSPQLLVKKARARLLQLGLFHPSASLLSPVDTEWLFRIAVRLAEALGSEEIAAVYLQARCAAPLAETIRRIEEMKPYWTNRSNTVNDCRASEDWERALRMLPNDLRKRLSEDPIRYSSNKIITATRRDWVQCFRALPPSWLDLTQCGPTPGQLLAALPDEAMLEADIDGYNGFERF